MRVLVCGGRGYTGDVAWVLDGLSPRPTTIITGCAKGADEQARAWARARGVTLDVYYANWNDLGRKAGPLRNQEMIDDGKPALVVAFPGGRGTADMVRRARVAGIEVMEVDGEREEQNR